MEQSRSIEEKPFETDSFTMCREVLDYVLWDGPSWSIPTHDQVREWRAALVARGPKFVELVANCDDFLSPPSDKELLALRRWRDET